MLGEPLTAAPDGQVIFEPGDVLFGKLRPYLAKSVFVDKPMQGSSEFLVLTPGETMDQRFLWFVTLSQPFLDHAEATSYGLKMPRTSWKELGTFNVPLPPLEEQRRIADFLDDQVTRIDSVNLDCSLQIERLAEATMAGPSELVSDPKFPRVPLKSIVIESDIRSGVEASPDSLLSVSIHHGVVPRREITQDEPRADSLANYKVVLVGDLVLNRMRAFQGGVGVARVSGVCSPDYAVLRPRVEDSSEYLHFVFRSHGFIADMAARLRGIGSAEQGSVRTPRINVADLLDIQIPFPSGAERRNVAEQCHDRLQLNEDLRENYAHSVRLLEERKRALITAAVTGQLDVTGGRITTNARTRSGEY
jgi:type I restriction enzyme S subunit